MLSVQHSPPLPRRRWFRFGLRTMFVVVTLFSVWLGWQAKIVRERKEALHTLGEEYPNAAVIKADADGYYGPRIRFAGWRRWLGDEPIAAFVVPRDFPAQKRTRLLSLFPEASGRCGHGEPFAE